MTTVYKIVIGVLIGIAITGWLFYGISTAQKNKVIETLNQRVKACENAPIHTDTIRIHDTVVINKTKVLTSYKTDTVVVNGHMVEVTSYKDTLKTKDFDLQYGVKVVGTLKEVEFPSYTLHTIEIVKTRTVDTCLTKKPAYEPKNHIGMDIDLIGNNIKAFPNVDALFFWSIKDRWKVNIGGEYNVYHGEAYLKAGIGIYFH